MKLLLLSPKNRTVYNFRGELIKELQKRGYEVSVTGPNRDNADKVEALGVRFIEIPMSKNGTSILSDLKYCRSLYKLMRREKPDVILGYTVKPVVYGALAGWLAGVKNINCLITGGGYTFTAQSLKARVLGTLVRTLYRLALHRADRVIFQNADDRDEFVSRRLVSKEKTQVVHGSGVDMTHFTPTPLPENAAFFMLSRLLKSKGVIEYLKAAEKVKRQYPGVRFALLGKYEYEMQDAVDREYVEKLISDGVIERFEETDDVRPYYSQCSVYVLPSYREGTPRTVLEAMAMGRPIITTDTNGCRDTVTDGVTGFLVPVRDADAVAEKMLWFIEHPEKTAVMGKASRELCKEKFDVVSVNQNMLKYMKIED